MLQLTDAWVWDFWVADDGDQYHAYFLYAPKALGQEWRRHRAARIGHAVSENLVDWTVVGGPIFDTGAPGSFDDTATWTGSVVKHAAGWRMFYTGSRFLEPEPAIANIETVGAASSPDLTSWRKDTSPAVRADPRWYETWGSGTWKEEAWRDPWVFRDPQGDGWHMLVTARANHGDPDDRGVIGHAVSDDLGHWEVRPPLSEPGAGFAHLEVPQVAHVDGQWVLLFSCGADTMTLARRKQYPDASTWSVPIPDPTRPFDLSDASPLLGGDLYSGRLVTRRDRTWAVMAFRTDDKDGAFIGEIADPIPVAMVDGRLTLQLVPQGQRPA